MSKLILLDERRYQESFESNGSFAAQKLVRTKSFVYCIKQLLHSGSYDGGNHENQTTRTPANSGNPA